MAELSLNDKAKNLLDYANENRKSGLFNDINIQVGNERFPCNKMVLSCYSTYFQTMFRTEMQERYQDTIELQGFDGKYMKMLIDYMYGETIAVDDGNVVQVLAAADYVQLQDVKDFCIECLKTSLSIANCLDALTAYSLYMPESSRDHIYLFISDNFDAVFQQEKFKNLTTNDLTTLLCKLNKNKVNQEWMFSAIISWVEHSKENRKDEFPSLFDLVDLSQLSAEFIENIAINKPIMEQNFHCLKLVVVALTSKLKQRGFKCTTSSERDSAILCLGGVGKLSVVEVLAVSDKLDTIYPDLPLTSSRTCAAIVNNCIYFVGSDTKNVFCLDLTDCHRKWTQVASMNKTKKWHSTAVFKGNIIVSDLSAAEMYEIDTNAWKNLQPLSSSGDGYALAVCRNCLYAIGGFTSIALQSIAKLHDLEGTWETAQPMNVPRNRLAAVSLDGEIYAIGGNSQGQTGIGVTKTVEKFVPEQNKWSYISDMNTARWDHAACVLGGKIYVVGGKDADGNYVTTIECYDRTMDSWKIVVKNVVELERHAVVVV